MTPTTDSAIRIANLFKRRLSTHWTDREIQQYKRLVKAGYFTDMKDLELVERYYVFERRKGEKGIHRRDLATFLNNYAGEVDRAVLWDMQFRKPRQQLKPPNQEKPTSDEEFKRIGTLAREQLEDFRERLTNPRTFITSDGTEDER